MAVNVTANWRLIRSLDPLLRHSEAGARCSSPPAPPSAAPAYWGPYAVSKAALEALVKTYAAETGRPRTLRANLSVRAPSAPRMRAKAMPGEDPRDAAAAAKLSPERCCRCSTRRSSRPAQNFRFPRTAVIEALP